MTVLVADRLEPSALDGLRALGVELHERPALTSSELAAALRAFESTDGITGFDPEIAVLADPGSCVRTYGTRDDFLIPSACLNSTVSGLISRTVLRADLERESRRYADALGLTVDWESVARLDDEMLVNGIAQVAPFDTGSKQALLEAADIAERADMLVQFMQFARLMPGGADGPGTLQ